MVTATRLHDEIDEILPGLIADRRYLHENPELGFQEFNTAKFVAERLQALGVEDIRTGINGTGITGLIRGTGSGENGVSCAVLAGGSAIRCPRRGSRRPSH